MLRITGEIDESQILKEPNLVFGEGIYGFQKLIIALIQVYALLSILAAIQIGIFVSVKKHINTNVHDHNNANPMINLTLASFPMSKAVCQFSPLTLPDFRLTCEGSDKILDIIDAGITYSNKNDTL